MKKIALSNHLPRTNCLWRTRKLGDFWIRPKKKKTKKPSVNQSGDLKVVTSHCGVNFIFLSTRPIAAGHSVAPFPSCRNSYSFLASPQRNYRNAFWPQFIVIKTWLFINRTWTCKLSVNSGSFREWRDDFWSYVAIRWVPSLLRAPC